MAWVPIYNFGSGGGIGAVSSGSAASTGLRGQDGATWFAGTTAPDAKTGRVSDFYLRTSDGSVWQKSAIFGTPPSWKKITSILGPRGLQGPAGPVGPIGPMGLSGSGGSGGSGTVTNVSVVSANGVSGVVANPTTTPAITLTLGDITPNSVTVISTAVNSGGSLITDRTTSATNVIENVHQWRLRSSLTTDVGFGMRTRWSLECADGNLAFASSMAVSLTDATSTTQYTAQTTFSAHDDGAAFTGRECIRIESNRTAAMVSFLGASAALQQTGDAGTALVTFGLMSGTPTFAYANVTGAPTIPQVPPYSSAVGQRGQDGATWYNGASAPLSTLGTLRDYYVQTSNANVWQKQSPAFGFPPAWAIIGNIKGAQGVGLPGSDGARGSVGVGPRGQDGSRWYSGPITPTSVLGNVGDFYLQTNTGDVWGKINPVFGMPPYWIKVTNLKGPTGAQGLRGLPGASSPITGPASPFVPGYILGASFVSTDESTTSTTAVDLTTVDSVTFQLNQTRVVATMFTCNAYISAGVPPLNTSNVLLYDGTQDANTANDTDCTVLNAGVTAPTYGLTTLGAGQHTVKVQHYVPNGGTGHFRRRLTMCWIVS